MDTPKKLLHYLRSAEGRLKAAQHAMEILTERLRKVCPHLEIAVCECGGRHTRICRACGIQEIAWYSDFSTLTVPGGTWYDGRFDKSRERRVGRAPVLFPMRVEECFKYRRSPFLDVSED